MVQLLLAQPNILVNLPNNDTGRTALHYACNMGHVEIVSRLLKHPDTIRLNCLPFNLRNKKAKLSATNSRMYFRLWASNGLHQLQTSCNSEIKCLVDCLDLDCERCRDSIRYRRAKD